MEANHLAELTLTGRWTIDVFQTLSAGKTGHVVPGRTVPGGCDDPAGYSVATAAEPTAATAPHTHTDAVTPHRGHCIRRRRCGMTAEYHSALCSSSPSCSGEVHLPHRGQLRCDHGRNGLRMSKEGAPRQWAKAEHDSVRSITAGRDPTATLVPSNT